LVNSSATTVYGYLSGTLDNTIYNDTIYSLQLDAGYTNGSYISQVFDVGDISHWKDISWVSNGMGELPNYQQVETRFVGGNVDMSGNVLLMHMNEASGTIVDYSGAGNDGSASGVVYGVDGRLGTALDFDGVDDYVSMGVNSLVPDLEGCSGITLSSWINPDSLVDAGSNDRNNIGDILINTSGNNNFSAIYLTLRYGGNIWCGGRSDPGDGFQSVETADTVVVGEWQHVVGVLDFANDKIYVYYNGDLVGEADVSFASDVLVVGTPTAHDVIGAIPSLNDHFFDGVIDEFAVWNRSLSEEEIIDVYTRGAINLDLAIRSCDDGGCGGDSWVDVDDVSPQDLSILDNQFFQYRFVFESDGLSYVPELYNVSVGYGVPGADEVPPEIANVSAEPDPQEVGGFVNITCDVTDNVGVNVVKVNITYPDSTYHNETMLGGSYYYNATYDQVGTYEYFIWANDTSGNANTSAIYHFELKRLYNISINTSWNLISIPFNESIAKTNIVVRNDSIDYNWTDAVSEGIVLDFFYKWEGTTYAYSDTLEPGFGYWMWAYYDCELLFLSNVGNDEYLTALQQNWNIMGLPYNETLGTDDIIVNYSNEDYTWDQAVADEIILGFIYAWNASEQIYMLSDSYDPGDGYWMYAYEDCVIKRVIV